ncbi:MAG: phage holin family protein [Candidatus Methylumidiphilus sp.]
MEEELPRPTATGDDSAGGSGVLENAQSLLHELLGLGQDRFRLAAMETRRAGESLVAMIVTGVMAGILLVSAWLGLLAAAVLWLVEHGIVPSGALLLAVAVSLLFALALWGVIRRKSRCLQFPATLRSLQPMPVGRQDAEKK